MREGRKVFWLRKMEYTCTYGHSWTGYSVTVNQLMMETTQLSKWWSGTLAGFSFVVEFMVGFIFLVYLDLYLYCFKWKIDWQKISCIFISRTGMLVLLIFKINLSTTHSKNTYMPIDHFNIYNHEATPERVSRGRGMRQGTNCPPHHILLPRLKKKNWIYRIETWIFVLSPPPTFRSVPKTFPNHCPLHSWNLTPRLLLFPSLHSIPLDVFSTSS